MASFDGPGIIDHAQHSAYSRPGRYAARFDEALAGSGDLVPAVSELARNVVVHYRASGESLPEANALDINLRWLADILDTDQCRHPLPLATPRALTERVQGCCRDHTLLSVGALRQFGLPARSRIGFASYFSPTWHHDHVIVEVWLAGRWLRFDPEVAAPLDALPDPQDIAGGPGAPFLTAAQVWLGHRDGSLDVTRFGVDEGLPPAGDWFVHNYVIAEVAHRFGDELLLWDGWGAMKADLATASVADLKLVDDVARLSLAADAGDQSAERDLLAQYREDPRLHPGKAVTCRDPFGGEHEVLLDRQP